jgi:hypothetical protein
MKIASTGRDMNNHNLCSLFNSQYSRYYSLFGHYIEKLIAIPTLGYLWLYR